MAAAASASTSRSEPPAAAAAAAAASASSEPTGCACEPSSSRSIAHSRSRSVADDGRRRVAGGSGNGGDANGAEAQAAPPAAAPAGGGRRRGAVGRIGRIGRVATASTASSTATAAAAAAAAAAATAATTAAATRCEVEGVAKEEGKQLVGGARGVWVVVGGGHHLATRSHIALNCGASQRATRWIRSKNRLGKYFRTSFSIVELLAIRDAGRYAPRGGSSWAAEMA